MYTMVFIESLARNPVCADISEGLSCRAGQCASQSVSQEGSWRYRSAGMKWQLIFLLQFLFTQYLLSHSEHHSWTLKMPFSESPFGRGSWAVYPVSDESHHALQTRMGSTPSEWCPGSLAQAPAELCHTTRQLGHRFNSVTFGWQRAHVNNPIGWVQVATTPAPSSPPSLE